MMTKPYRAIPLAGGRLAQALPLIQVTWPEIGMARWRDFVDAMGRDGGGVLALHEADDYICGLLAYRRHLQLGGPVLLIPLFTVADIVNRQAVTQALIEAAERLARQLGCAALRLELDKRQGRLLDRLGRLGLAADEVFLLRRRCD